MRNAMRNYIAVIHKESGSEYGVSFPDVPGVIASAATLDAALTEAREALAFAAEDWAKLSGKAFPQPRTLDALRSDASFREAAADAVIAAVPLEGNLGQAA
jgi:predicted RNase H-like HicB family nuclease